MPTKIENRRRDVRNPIPEFLEAQIEFSAPDGSSQELPLIELSVSGGSFRMPQRIPGLKAGVMIDIALIRVGEIEIRSHVEMLHVTRGGGSSYVCGVRLYPATDDDRNELIGLVSRLGSVPA